MCKILNLTLDLIIADCAKYKRADFSGQKRRIKELKVPLCKFQPTLHFDCFNAAKVASWFFMLHTLPCTWAWAGSKKQSRVCVVLSIEPDTWKDWGRSLSLIWIYLNDWVKYYPCFLNAWIYGYPQSLDRESCLCHPSREGLTQCLKESLSQWFFSQYCQCS